MRGLDNWIMGVNDPNAPFNQTDWVEQYEPVLDKCEWVTEEMLDDDSTYEKLGAIFDRVITEKSEYSFLRRKEFYAWLSENAETLSDKIKQEYGKENR